MVAEVDFTAVVEEATAGELGLTLKLVEVTRTGATRLDELRLLRKRGILRRGGSGLLLRAR